MKPLAVYSVLDIEPIKAQGTYIWDKNGNKYLDFYGGHAVISIGHRHPKWVAKLKAQIDQIPFYSNAVIKPIEDQFAQKLGEISGYTDYDLFMCNSGAEAVENALKAASFATGRKKVLAFNGAFHGRTSAAVAVSGYTANISELNSVHEVSFVQMNDLEAVRQALETNKYAAIIIEGIQGVGGIIEPNANFMQQISTLCTETGTKLILDEVQSGFGRTGKFFAHQHADIKPDLITIAKGMGNGFPMAGVLVGSNVPIKNGQLGSTFGGNHMACAAGLAVLEVIESEKLLENAANVGAQLKLALTKLPKVKEVRGRGLMLAIELTQPAADVRKNLLFEQKLFTGHSGKNAIRLLPPLNVSYEQAHVAVGMIEKAIKSTLL